MNVQKPVAAGAPVARAPHPPGKPREGFVEQPQPTVIDAAPVPTPPPNPEPLAAEPPPEPKKEWPVTVQLKYKPIRVRGVMVNELVFREPTGADINRYGNPVHVTYEGEARIDEKKMSMMMSSLAGALMPDLDAMDPRDWNSCAYRLRGFFLPDPEAWL